MQVLENEVCELNGNLLDLAHRHSDLLAEHFDGSAEGVAEIRAGSLLSIEGEPPVPPALLPRKILNRFRWHNTAFRAATEFIFTVRAGGSWSRLAEELRLEKAARAFIDFDLHPRLTQVGGPHFVLHGDALTMAEPNCGTSADALEYSDILGRVFESAPVIGDYLRKVGAKRADVVRSLAGVLRVALAKAGQPPDGLVVVTDFGEEIEFDHFDGLTGELRRHGLNVATCPIESLEVGSNGVFAYGRPCALIYQISAEQPDPERNLQILPPLLDARRRGLVGLVDDPADQLAARKTVMALVSRAIDEDELPRKLVHRLSGFIPWTRILEEGYVTIGGSRVDLVPWCLRNREELVVQRGSGHRGRGVILGRGVNESQWRDALDEALRAPEAWLVQRLARSSYVRVSVCRWGELASEESFLDYSYFAIGPHVPVAELRQRTPFRTPTHPIKPCGIGPVFYI